MLRMQHLLPLACFTVMMNYLIVLCTNPELPLSFQSYLILGTFAWSLSAIRGGWLLGDDQVVSSLREEAKAARRSAAQMEQMEREGAYLYPGACAGFA